MRFWYRTLALAPALLGGCTSGPGERVAIVAHYVPACAPEAGEAPTQLELIALGDFDRSIESVSILPSQASRQSLELPEETRAVVLSTLGERTYWGTGARVTHHPISVLLWPRERACPLAQLEATAQSEGDGGESGSSSNSNNGGGWLLGGSRRSSRVLALRTTSDATGGAPRGFSIDLGTARVTELTPERGLRAARAFASLSELGERFLVAGGLDPGTGLLRADAEVFDPGRDTFLAPPLALARPRARHTALSLPSGATLLIGGEDEGGTALRSVEVLSPEGTRSARALDLLGSPRIQPTALLLGDGRILVGGGFVWDADASGGARARRPIASVEFLSFDSIDVAQAPLRLEPAALDRAFVELAGGSALAAGGCVPARSEAGCLPCEAGTGCVSREVWWIDPQGGAHALEPLPDVLSAAAPQLVAAAEGAPWLIANGRLARFDPWSARFQIVAAPGLDTLDLTLPPVAIDPGLFVWLQPNAGALDVLGLSTSQRGAFTQDIAPLLLGSSRGLVPHRPATAPARPDAALQYRAESGLTLAGSAAAVSIADTDYADVSVDVQLASGPAPVLRLVGSGATAGQATSFGALDCAWPDFAPPTRENPSSWVRLRLQRAGDEVRLAIATDANGATPDVPVEPCVRPLPERVGLQLLGTPLGPTTLLRIEVRRSVE